MRIDADSKYSRSKDLACKSSSINIRTKMYSPTFYDKRAADIRLAANLSQDLRLKMRNISQVSQIKPGSAAFENAEKTAQNAEI